MKLTSFINKYIWGVIMNKKCHRCNRFFLNLSCIYVIEYLLSKFGIHKITTNRL